MFPEAASSRRCSLDDPRSQERRQHIPMPLQSEAARRRARWLLFSIVAVCISFIPSRPDRLSAQEEFDEVVFLPLLRNGHVTPDRIWDPRLAQRGARLTTPEPSSTIGGYWRLTEAVWFNREESGGRHHIYIEVLDQEGLRLLDVPIAIGWPGNNRVTILTERKEGEPYAADYPMFSLAPAYWARPDTNAPADSVHGMGLGEIDDPDNAHHTSYGLTWQWTAPSAPATPTPTATSTSTPTDASTFTPTSTSTPAPGTPTGTPPSKTTATATGTVTVTPTVTSTPSATATSTSTASPTATPSVTPTVTATTVTALAYQRVEYVNCVADAHASRVEGTVFKNGEPVDDVRVVFNYEPNNDWATDPTLSGPNPPGFYAHIINARTGNWWVWLVNSNGNRISKRGAFTFDEASCTVATLDFHDR